ncbi:MAG: hypothetical protein AAB628_01000 [Patescibacteria group bacterium]
MRYQVSQRRGFTLIETIIYVSFLAILSAIAIQSTLVVMNSFYKMRLTQSVNQSATVGLERMSREIRNAYAIDTTNSVFGTNPGRLTLMTKDSLGANMTIEFYVNNSELMYKENGVDKGSLMTKNARLTNLVFRQMANPNSQGVRIEMEIRDTRGVLSESAKFYNTVVLRGSAK